MGVSRIAGLGFSYRNAFLGLAGGLRESALRFGIFGFSAISLIRRVDAVTVTDNIKGSALHLIIDACRIFAQNAYSHKMQARTKPPTLMQSPIPVINLRGL
jgi:hypothetical protein